MPNLEASEPKKRRATRAVIAIAVLGLVALVGYFGKASGADAGTHGSRMVFAKSQAKKIGSRYASKEEKTAITNGARSSKPCRRRMEAILHEKGTKNVEDVLTKYPMNDDAQFGYMNENGQYRQVDATQKHVVSVFSRLRGQQSGYMYNRLGNRASFLFGDKTLITMDTQNCALTGVYLTKVKRKAVPLVANVRPKKDFLPQVVSLRTGRNNPFYVKNKYSNKVVSVVSFQDWPLSDMVQYQKLSSSTLSGKIELWYAERDGDWYYIRNWYYPDYAWTCTTDGQRRFVIYTYSRTDNQKFHLQEHWMIILLGSEWFVKSEYSGTRDNIPRLDIVGPSTLSMARLHMYKHVAGSTATSQDWSVEYESAPTRTCSGFSSTYATFKESAHEESIGIIPSGCYFTAHIYRWNTATSAYFHTFASDGYVAGTRLVVFVNNVPWRAYIGGNPISSMTFTSGPWANKRFVQYS